MPITEAAEATAHREAVEARIADVAGYLQEVLGQKLTAFIAGVADAKTVGKWARDVNAPRSEAEPRLRAAYQVFKLLQEHDSEGVVRSWFIGMNPHLNNHSPAEALREDQLRQVASAARLFVQSG